MQCYIVHPSRIQPASYWHILTCALIALPDILFTYAVNGGSHFIWNVFTPGMTVILNSNVWLYLIHEPYTNRKYKLMVSTNAHKCTKFSLIQTVNFPDGVIGGFSLTGRNRVLESTQPLTEMNTRNISWGKGGRCLVLTTWHLHVKTVSKSGSLKLLVTSGPVINRLVQDLV